MTIRSKIILASLLLAGIATLGAYFASSALASEGWKKGNWNNKKRVGQWNCDSNHAGDIKKALETSNYDLWKSAMGDRPITKKITADNFSKLVEIYNLIKEKKYADAANIAKELGLGNSYRHASGLWMGLGRNYSQAMWHARR